MSNGIVVAFDLDEYLDREYIVQYLIDEDIDDELIVIALLVGVSAFIFYMNYRRN